VTICRNNALFLSTVDQRNGKIAHQVIQWFNKQFILLSSPDVLMEQLVTSMLEHKELHEEIVNFIKQVDVTIEDVFGWNTFLEEDNLSRGSMKMPRRAIMVRRRRADGVAVDFDLASEESAGTRRVMWLGAYLLGILANGSVTFADELEARLHPHLTRKLVRLFNSPERNSKNAQLIFVTHDTNLLTYGGLRRDQVWFCEKNRAGSTDLYSLAEIKVRKGACFENDYIGGKYGAIPYFGNVKDIGGEKE